MLFNNAVSFTDIVAPPKAPAKIPMRVIPIWTVERKVLGDFESFNAATALLLPPKASFFNLDLDDETIANSEPAKSPFRKISSNIITTSNKIVSPKVLLLILKFL